MTVLGMEPRAELKVMETLAIPVISVHGAPMLRENADVERVSRGIASSDNILDGGSNADRLLGDSPSELQLPAQSSMSPAQSSMSMPGGSCSNRSTLPPLKQRSGIFTGTAHLYRRVYRRAETTCVR